MAVQFLSILSKTGRYLDVPEDSDSFDVSDILKEFPAANKKFNLEKFHHKMKNVQALYLKTLKKTKNCRLQCKPAIDFYNSGAAISLKESEPQVQIMILHCMHCLKSKGLMVKINERRRRKREIIDQMRATPIEKPTQPMRPRHSIEKSSGYKHNMFGGWISKVLQMKTRVKKKRDAITVFRSRRLMNSVQRQVKRLDKTKVLTAPKKQIVIKENDDDDYENNYEDNFDSDVPDLEEKTRKIKDAVKYLLIGAFVFSAFLLMFLFPVVKFTRMCRKNYNSNVLILSDVLCCRDPRYRLVKEMCDEYKVPIPDYHLYKKLMRFYRAKDRETVAKEKLRMQVPAEESENE